ncbi:hypothetical protein PWR63_00155 [Paraburkholderia sp. A2WS-5]|uniref:hypothetical protein n=1 Tax=unclassified Paraburkholderia TaxID=2615204 RepID=UPI003B7EA010
MKLKTDWRAVRSRIEAALHYAKLHNAPGSSRPGEDNRAWVIIYRTANGFCCMYQELPVDFEDMLDVQTWAEEMDVRPYFMGM